MTEKKQPLITVTLNPALDHTIYLPKFHAGEVNRVQTERLDPGGKGINVATVIKSLGEEVKVTGFLGRDNAHKFNRFFNNSDIENHFIPLKGSTRVNMKLIDQSTQAVTEVNFPGLTFSELDRLRLEETIKYLAADSGAAFILSGSLPPEAPPEIYGDLICLIKSLGNRVFLDTSGLAFAKAIAAKPYAIKPNINELSQFSDLDLQQPSNLHKTVDHLLASGIELVVVSLGAQGALFAKGTEKLLAKAPSIAIGSTVGAGDAMVAGMAVATTRQQPLAELARLATAAAVAAVAKQGTQSGSLTEINQLLPLIQITNWEES